MFDGTVSNYTDSEDKIELIENAGSLSFWKETGKSIWNYWLRKQKANPGML